VNGPAETVFAGATIPTTPGTHSYTATYTADANYLTSVSSAQSVVVKLGSNLGVQATPSQIVTGQSTTLAGQVSTGNQSPTPGPTGTVTFTGSVTGQIKSPATCMTTVLSGNEGCQATVSYSPASSETVTATYSGDTNYAPDTFSPPISIVVTQPSFSLAASSTMVTAGGSGSSTITVTPTVGFTGMVAVTCPSLPPGVTCSPLNINVPGGSAVMGTLMVNVTGPSPMMMASTAPTSQVLSAGNVLPDDSARGWWTFSGGTGLAALVLLFLLGRKRYRAALRLGLICVLSFTLGCGGGSSGAGVTPPVTTTTQVVVSSTKVASTAMITISANVSGGSPAGNVQFFVDGAAMPGSSQLTNGSTGQIILPALTLFSSIGTHTLSAHYPGSATTTASQSGSLNVTLTGTTQLSISANPAPVSGGQTISLTIN